MPEYYDYKFKTIWKPRLTQGFIMIQNVSERTKNMNFKWKFEQTYKIN